MRRAFPVLLSILIGAIAVGGGMFVYLTKANADRARLAGIAEKAQQDSKTAIETSQRTIEEANKKVDAANVEITKAQKLVADMREERQLLATATKITAPTPKSLKGWKEAVSIGLGVTFKFPATLHVDTNDDSGLTLADANGRVFSLTTYDERLETDLMASFVTSTPVSFDANGRLFVGTRGKISSDQGTVFLLRLRHDGTTSHLLWMRLDERTTETLLSTIDLRS